MSGRSSSLKYLNKWSCTGTAQLSSKDDVEQSNPLKDAALWNFDSILTKMLPNLSKFSNSLLDPNYLEEYSPNWISIIWVAFPTWRVR